MINPFKKLKTFRLCLSFFRSKYKNEYFQYDMCPGFTIWTANGSIIQGHIIIKKSDSKTQIKNKIIDCVSKLCEKEKLTEKQTINTINNNLKYNGFTN
jgi:hypothetical protein